jgi:hypothetical protein
VGAETALTGENGRYRAKKSEKLVFARLKTVSEVFVTFYEAQNECTRVFKDRKMNRTWGLR